MADITIYIWNPSTANNQTSNGLTTIIKSFVKRGNVGHMSLALTAYEDSYNLSSLQMLFPSVNFKPATPIYSKVKKNRNGLLEYSRGKQLSGLTATHSFWPTIPVNLHSFFSSFFKVKSTNPPNYATIEEDMISESLNSELKIHHKQKFYNGEFRSSRQQKMNELNALYDGLGNKLIVLDKEVKAINTTLEKMKEEYSSIEFIPNKNNPFSEKVFDALKGKVKGRFLPNEGFLEDRDAKVFADSIKADTLQQELDEAKKRAKLASNAFLELVTKLEQAPIEKLNSFAKEYLDEESTLQRLTTLADNSYNQAMKEISETKMFAIRGQIIAELNKLQLELPIDFMDEFNRFITVDVEIDKQFMKIWKLSSVIEKINIIKTRLNQIDMEKKKIQKEKSNIATQQNALGLEINQDETTTGRHADIIFSLPTSQSGRKYFINELDVLSYMQNSRNLNNYDLLRENCAGTLKKCILAGIKNNLELQRELLDLPGIPLNFLENKEYENIWDTETMNSVMNWLFKLKDGIEKLNVAHEKSEFAKLSVKISCEL